MHWKWRNWTDCRGSISYAIQRVCISYGVGREDQMLPTLYLRDKGGRWWLGYGPTLMVNERQHTAKDRTINVSSFSVRAYVPLIQVYPVGNHFSASWITTSKSIFPPRLVWISPPSLLSLLSVTTVYFFHEYVRRCNFKQCVLMYTMKNRQSVMAWFSFDLNHAITVAVFDMNRSTASCCDVVCAILAV